MKLNDRFTAHLKLFALCALACALMIIVSELAHQARKKPTIKANVYPTINNHNIKPLKTTNK